MLARARKPLNFMVSDVFVDAGTGFLRFYGFEGIIVEYWGLSFIDLRPQPC